MEHPILFLPLLLEKLGLPVPHVIDASLPWYQQILHVHMVYTWFIMICLILVAKLTVGNQEMIPGKGQNFWEAILGGLNDFYVENMGEEGARMLFPMLTTFALFILISNLVGLMPAFFSPTANINITLGCTLIVWVTSHILGIKYHGVKYIKHFLGPMPWLIPLMFPIEIISNFARILSLSIRLFGNIMAKEILLAVLFMLAGAYFGPLPILCLGVLVSFVQAGVFVLLSVVYFSGAMEHAH